MNLSNKRLHLVATASLSLIAWSCVSTPTPNKAVVLSGDGKQVAMQLSRDSRSLLSDTDVKAATEAHAGLMARTDLTAALIVSAAELSLLSNNPDQAAREARSILKKDFRNAEAMRVLIKVSIFQKRYDEALLMANNALAVQPRDADILSLRGMAYYFSNQPVLAREDWKKASDVNPMHIPSQMNLAALFYQNRYVNLAGASFDKVLTLQPSNIDAMVGKALVQCAQGNELEARNQLNLVLAKNPKSSIVLYNLAAIERERFQNYPAAVAYLDRYLALTGQERMTVERAIATREELKLMIARKSNKLSDDELRTLAAKSSQAAQQAEESEVNASSKTQVVSDASQADQSKKQQSNTSNKQSSSTSPANNTAAKTAPTNTAVTKPKVTTPAEREDATFLENAIK